MKEQYYTSEKQRGQLWKDNLLRKTQNFRMENIEIEH